jgi:hypothetical protein
MSATEATDPPTSTDAQPVAGPCPEPALALEFSLSEAEALRTWLLKSVVDGATALDDPLVSGALANFTQAVDSAHATASVRRELQEAGLAVDHLTDEQVRELGRRVAEVATPAIRV